MPQVQSTVGQPSAILGMIAEAKVRLPTIAERVTSDIQATVPGFAGRAEGRRSQLIRTAINNAAQHFLDHALGDDTGADVVDDLYRTMGFRQGASGQDFHALDSAIRIASRACWDELRVLAADRDVPPAALDDVSDALTAFVDHLTAQIRAGFDDGAQARDKDNGLARARLLTMLLRGADEEQLGLQATVADWPLPCDVVVTAVDLPEGASLDPALLDPVVLCRTGEQRAVLVCAPDASETAVKEVRRQLPRARAAVCWPVRAEDVPSAHRWTQRALGLVDAGVIPARPVIDCAQHRTVLWLHAEPVLRQHLAQELLQPLFSETRNSREILSETLLVWLETRGSAPAIAAKLGVHPQTVRYRWRRINELFGESLHDPEFVIQLTMVLKASVSLWIAGDQSDFERFAMKDEP